MTVIELKLKEYLSKNPEVIEKSLKDNFYHYDFIKVDSVEIEDDFFSAYCQIIEGNRCGSNSPFLPIPKKFLRKNKLEQINKK